MNESEKFETSDARLAAVLVVNGINYLEMKKEFDENSKRDKGVFVFNKQEGLDEVVSNFFSRNIKVEPISLLHVLRSIKIQLYNFLNNVD